MMKPNSMGRYWLFSLVFYSFFGAATCINITLNEHDACAGSTTCDWHILNMKHNISFSCLVDYTEDPLAKFVYFQILKQTDDTFNYLCDIDLRTDCTRVESQNECSCITLREYLVEINITVPARTFLNGALLRGIAIRSHDNKEFISEERMFPEIFDDDGGLLPEMFFLFLPSLSIPIWLIIIRMYYNMGIQWIIRTIKNYKPPVKLPKKRFIQFFSPNDLQEIFWSEKPQNYHTRVQDLLPRKKTLEKMKSENCINKDKHTSFISFSEFAKNRKLGNCDLKIEDDTYTYISTAAKLSVLLQVEFISSNRPELYSVGNSNEGEITILTGSGFLINEVKISKHPCRCNICTDWKNEPRKTFSVYIATATHVVYNDEEAANLKVKLHFTDLGTEIVKEVHGVSVCERSVNGDSCIVECVTCDQRLANELKTALDNYKECYSCFRRDVKPIAVTISHPHGQDKQISWGECQKLTTERDALFDLTSYKHNSSICPGSCGAPVILLNDTELLMLNLSLQFTRIKEHPFNGEEIQADLKYPQAGEDILSKQETVGEHCESKMSCFSRKHLPKIYQDTDLLPLLECLAYLTCQLDVRLTSKMRPKFWPETSVPYAFTNKIRSKDLRSGCGCIVFARKIGKEKNMLCYCSKCQGSQARSNVFYFIYIKAAASHVYDDNESSRTTVYIDDDDLNSSSKLLVGCQVVDCDIESDICLLEHVTCNFDLGDRIIMKTQKLWELNKNLLDTIISEQHFERMYIVILLSTISSSKYISVGSCPDTNDSGETYEYVISKLTINSTNEKFLMYHTIDPCMNITKGTDFEKEPRGTKEDASNITPILNSAAIFMLGKKVAPDREKFIIPRIQSEID